jgi:hypothetical protein
MSAKRRRNGGADRRNTGDKKRSRQATRENRASEAKSREPIREGTPGQMATRLAEREARGEMIQYPEATDLSLDDLNQDEILDSEIEMDDADLTPLDEIDLTEESGAMSAITPAGTFFSNAYDNDGLLTYELRIDEDGHCWFQRPPWVMGCALAQAAEDDLDDAAIRFAMFDALASWLERERPAFLKNPEPLALGINALDEMKQGLPSVVPGAFLKLSELEEVIISVGEKTKKAKSVESYFSRYSTAASLVWSNGRQSLDFLFSHDARVAWVACAVRQFFAREIKEPLSNARIAELREVSIPKEAADREDLGAMSVTSLTIPEFVARANQMAGMISWDEVRETYFQEHTKNRYARS